MKDRILAWKYDEETGHSYMMKQTRYGIFEAEVQVAPADKDIQNEWDAGLFCEYKCNLQSLHEKVKKFKIEYSLIKKISNDEKLINQYKIRYFEAKKEYLDRKRNYMPFVCRTLDARYSFRKSRESNKDSNEDNC